MTSAGSVALSPSKYVMKERVSPNAVVARGPAPPEYLCNVPSQQQHGGPNKKRSENFHTHLHAEVGGGARRGSPLGLFLAAVGQGQAA
jgi:hypothetical protein